MTDVIEYLYNHLLVEIKDSDCRELFTKILKELDMLSNRLAVLEAKH